MLTKRCRDLAIRDLLIEQDPHTGELATHPFRAVGVSWEVIMDRAPAGHNTKSTRWDATRGDSSAIPSSLTPLYLSVRLLCSGADPLEVKIYLRIVDRPQRKLILECFVLSGPDLPFELSPTLRRVVFRKSVGVSESFPLPVTAEQAREIHNRQTLSLRVGFVDCTIGPMTQDFTSVRQGPYAALRDSDGESSDGSDRDRSESPVLYPNEVDDDGFDDEPPMDDYLDAVDTDAPEPEPEPEPAAADEADEEPPHDHAQQHQQHDDGEQAQYDDEDIPPPTLEEEEAAQDLDAYDGEGEGEPEAEAEGEVGEGGGESFEGELDDIEDDDEEDEPQRSHSAASSSSSAAAAAAGHSSMAVYSQPGAYSSRPAASPAPRAYSQR